MFCRSERVDDKKREEISVSGVNDVVMILKSDYENAYFVTGTFLPLENFVLIEQVKNQIMKSVLFQHPKMSRLMLFDRYLSDFEIRPP